MRMQVEQSGHEVTVLFREQVASKTLMLITPQAAELAWRLRVSMVGRSAAVTRACADAHANNRGGPPNFCCAIHRNVPGLAVPP